MQRVKKIINKWNSLSDVTKASIVFIISSFVIKGVNFITTPIFTRIINQTEYGTIQEYNSWQTILEVFALLGLTSAGVFNVGMKDYKNQRNQYMSSVLILCNIVTIIVFSIIFILKKLIGNSFLLPANLLILMFIYFIFSPAQIFWITRQKYEYKYKLAVLITILSTLLSQGFSVLMVIYTKTTRLAEVKLWSSFGFGLLFSVPIYIYVLISGKSYKNIRIWKQVLIFAFPLLPHYLAQHVMSGADRIMIADFATKADAGIYGVVLNISVIATIVWNSINASLVPLTFENLESKKYKSINNAIIPVITCYAVFCCLVALIAPEIIRFLAPEEYYFGVYAVPPIVATAFLSALYNIYANIEFYHKKSFNIALATVIAAIVNIILNFLFIPKFSFISAAYTTLLSNIILICVHYWGYTKCQKQRIYNDKIILFVSIMCILICELANVLYLNNIIRYCIMGICGVFLIIKRKVIFNMMQNIRIRKNK